MNALVKSVARTLIPYVVGLIVTLALRAGVDLHGYGPELTVAVGFVYYSLVRFGESYVSEHFGWLLGVAARPVYPPTIKVRKDSGYGLVELLVAVLVVIVILIVLLKLINHL